MFNTEKNYLIFLTSHKLSPLVSSICNKSEVPIPTDVTHEMERNLKIMKILLSTEYLSEMSLSVVCTQLFLNLNL